MKIEKVIEILETLGRRGIIEWDVEKITDDIRNILPYLAEIGAIEAPKSIGKSVLLVLNDFARTVALKRLLKQLEKQ